ncbi:hypothetical protein F511_34948 [Dorcoceras hygrometricum]|uniref:Uncharacterized protein n=1 Tax=Dorcoceras hygrometricum TaxID=472368 RepID=A0A2Z7CB58_9LAMI|nr:hypothetical protein F511_34948 [Dorcoceras hygrometricum]
MIGVSLTRVSNPRLARTNFTRKSALQRLTVVVLLIRSTTEITIPSLVCTRKRDEYLMDRISSSRQSEQVRRRQLRTAAAARDGRLRKRGGGGHEELSIQQLYLLVKIQQLYGLVFMDVLPVVVMSKFDDFVIGSCWLNQYKVWFNRQQLVAKSLFRCYKRLRKFQQMHCSSADASFFINISSCFPLIRNQQLHCDFKFSGCFIHFQVPAVALST